MKENKIDRQKIIEMINNKFNEIAYIYQKEHGRSGDIAPEIAFELELIEQRLADIIIEEIGA